MPYRDDNEALRAQISTLKTEIDVRNKKITELEVDIQNLIATISSIRASEEAFLFIKPRPSSGPSEETIRQYAKRKKELTIEE